MPAPTPHPEKPQLRRLCRQRAAALATQAPTWSAALCRVVLDSSEYQGAAAIMLFLPLPPPAVEPDLAPIAAAALAAGKIVCLPRIDWDTGVMEPAAITSLDSLTTTRHGIREPLPPPHSQPIPIEQLALILVPGLAFDERGNRLGRGAGYYDRFLAARRPPQSGRPGAIACGVCFEAQLLDRIPTDPWDVPMNTLATERRLVRLRP
jgi:5-formyltetrahydrofolate cyclo-ligase